MITNNRLSRFVIWICSKFTRSDIEFIVDELLDILKNRNPEVKPKDDIKEQQPNYRSFFVDPTPPFVGQRKKKYWFDHGRKSFKCIFIIMGNPYLP